MEEKKQLRIARKKQVAWKNIKKNMKNRSKGEENQTTWNMKDEKERQTERRKYASISDNRSMKVKVIIIMLIEMYFY